MTTFTQSAIRVGALCVSLVALVPPVSAQPAKVEQELMQIERDWCAATLKNDAALLGGIVADDVSDISRAGKLSGKAEMLAGVKTGKTTVCEVDQMKVRVYGDAAVVTGRSTLKSDTFSGQSLWTDTFIRKNGKWLCVATQSSEVKAKK